MWLQFCDWAYRNLLARLFTPRGGVGIAVEIPEGHAVEDERLARASRLYALCEEAASNPAWFQREDGTTYCNRAAEFIAQGMGCFDFRHGMSANEMIDFLWYSGRWRVETPTRAVKHAERGGLAFLTLRQDAGGYICAIAPLPMQDSPSWGRAVPIVANIGPREYHGIRKASVAFPAKEKDHVVAFIYMGDTA